MDASGESDPPSRTTYFCSHPTALGEPPLAINKTSAAGSKSSLALQFPLPLNLDLRIAAPVKLSVFGDQPPVAFLEEEAVTPLPKCHTNNRDDHLRLQVDGPASPSSLSHTGSPPPGASSPIPSAASGPAAQLAEEQTDDLRKESIWTKFDGFVRSTSKGKGNAAGDGDEGLNPLTKKTPTQPSAAWSPMAAGAKNPSKPPWRSIKNWTLGRRAKQEKDGFRLDLDFSDLHNYVRQPTTPPPNAGSSDVGGDDGDSDPGEQQTVPDCSWEPPANWVIQAVWPPPPSPAAEEPTLEQRETEPGREDADYSIRMYRTNDTYTTVASGQQTTATEVLLHLERKGFLQGNAARYQIVMKRGGKRGLFQRLGPNERPLMIQKAFLEAAGYIAEDDLAEVGRGDHRYIARFDFGMARAPGITLDQQPRSTIVSNFNHIRLARRNMVTIPTPLYDQAARILSMDISYNPSLAIPIDFIPLCVNLRHIEYKGCEAEELPDSIAKTYRLTHLIISDNRLRHLDNLWLQEPRGLIILKMANNQVRSLPDQFCKFLSLRTLDMSSNQLTEFPAMLCQFVHLLYLDICFNRITSFPSKIGSLVRLERLFAAHNQLTGALPPSFSNLRSLEELDLRHNQLGNIDAVANLPVLHSFTVSHNRLSSYEPSFDRLLYFNANFNPASRFRLSRALPTLQSLTLSNAKLSLLDESLFENLPNLVKLVLDRNSLIALPPAIAKLRKLRTLSCGNNELSTVPKEIGLLHALRNLDLHYNNIKILPGEIWQMISLRSLNLSSNVLDEFPKPAMVLLDRVAILGEAYPSLSHSSASSYSPSTPNLRSTGTFKQVEDSGRGEGEYAATGHPPYRHQPGNRSNSAHVEDDEKRSVDSFHNADGKNITPNAGGEVGSGDCSNGAAAKEDSAEFSIADHTFAHRLGYLYLADNNLSDECFEELSLLETLRVLNLSYNDLYEIPPTALSRMIFLRELFLSGNNLIALPAEDLRRITNLTVLYVNNNKLQTLPAELGKFPDFRVLDAGNNALKYNVTNWRYDWNWNCNPGLNYLSLSGNPRLQIKPFDESYRERALSNFLGLTDLCVLGLMDVIVKIQNPPRGTANRRPRVGGSRLRSMSFGVADCLGPESHLSLVDMIVPNFRGSRHEWLVGIFDGQSTDYGGSRAVKFLHDAFPSRLKEELRRLRPGEQPPAALRRAFLDLNKDVGTETLDKGGLTISWFYGSGGAKGDGLEPEDWDAGAISTVAYRVRNKLFVANIGDAMAVLSRTDGSFLPLTQKHTAQLSSEVHRVRDACGWISRTGKLNDRLRTTRSFGYFNLMPALNAAPHICEVKIEVDTELLILASRGLWDYLSFQTAVDIARTEKSDLMRAAHKLRDMAIAYGCRQKIMVIVLGVGDVGQHLRFPGPGSMPQEGQANPIKVTRRWNKKTDNSVGAPVGELALVFTDIKNSTFMWDNYPLSMRSGIRVHNNIMRRQLRQLGGYEVKTEGDAFMVSFHTVTSALLWCFTVQQYLLDQEWPEDILESENGREIRDARGNVIYKGLSVRMGVHWGSPVCEPDPITARMDYFGPMVNRAARVSGAADGGDIAVSSDCLAELNRGLEACESYHKSKKPSIRLAETIFGDVKAARNMMDEVEQLKNKGFEVRELGERKLKGLGVPEFIFLMYPRGLAGRFEAKAKAAAAPMTDLPFSPKDLNQLWEISLRLERMCSALNHGSELSEVQNSEMTNKLQELANGVSDQVMVQLLEHVVAGIENCVSILYLRRILSPLPARARTFQQGTRPLMDMIDMLAAQLGVVGIRPAARVHDGDYGGNNILSDGDGDGHDPNPHLMTDDDNDDDDASVGAPWFSPSSSPSQSGTQSPAG